MMIETTINIHSIFLEQINRAALKTGKSRNQIIIMLIKKQMDDMQGHIQNGKRIQYQEKASREYWHTIHLQLRPDDYEYFLDLRKLLKMSISRILALAVLRYLKNIIKSKITDNYHYKNYIIQLEIIDGIICWKLLWGFPRNPVKLFASH
ncbi:MAG: hypothetical protein JXA07_04860 [Spirochaetes bacterium]|nr:hypothetical protein [Spirochaetota bacterium]